MTDGQWNRQDRKGRVWLFAAGKVYAIPESSCVQPKRHVTAINYEVARLLHRTYRRSLRDTTTID